MVRMIPFSTVSTAPVDWPVSAPKNWPLPHKSPSEYLDQTSPLIFDFGECISASKHDLHAKTMWLSSGSLRTDHPSSRNTPAGYGAPPGSIILLGVPHPIQRMGRTVLPGAFAAVAFARLGMHRGDGADIETALSSRRRAPPLDT